MYSSSLLPPVTLIAGLLSAASVASHADRPRSAFAIEQVRAGKKVTVSAAPRGRVVARLGSRTEFGSPRTLPVVARRGQWLGVTDTSLGNGRVGWVRRDPGSLQQRTTRFALRIDLAQRRLEVLDGSRVERRMPVGVGGASSPTPRGRFSITDKLPGAAYGSAYGCCILALSGSQTRTPPGWRGGDRLAIHGGGVNRSSLGCLHARTDDLEFLMRRVSLGTPVFIH